MKMHLHLHMVPLVPVQTYNNEFMVTNMGLFKPGSPPQPGTVYLLDQVGGYPSPARGA